MSLNALSFFRPSSPPLPLGFGESVQGRIQKRTLEKAVTVLTKTSPVVETLVPATFPVLHRS